MACLKVRNIRVCQTDPKENPCTRELVPFAAAFEAFLFESVLRNWTRLSMACCSWSAHEGGQVDLRLGALSKCYGIEICKCNLEISHSRCTWDQEGLLKIENYLWEMLFSNSPPSGPSLPSSMTISFHHQIRAKRRPNGQVHGPHTSNTSPPKVSKSASE